MAGVCGGFLRPMAGAALVLACGPSASHEMDDGASASASASVSTSASADDASSGADAPTGDTGPPDAGSAIPCDPVIFADPQLEAAVREALEIAVDVPLSVESLAPLTGLQPWNAGIGDLHGIECASALESLGVFTDVGGIGEPNTIADLTPITEMPSLYFLDVRSNAVTEFVPLPYLGMLDATGNPIASLAGLVGSDVLTMLVVSDSPLADLGPVPLLPALEDLTADRTAVVDLSALAGCASLESLSVVETAVSDLGVVDELPALDIVLIDDTQVSDLSVFVGREMYRIHARSIAITELPADLWVTYSDFSDNGLTDLAPLLTWESPRQVSLADNAIDDVTPLLSIPWDQRECLHIVLEGNPLRSPDVASVLQEVCATFRVNIQAGRELSCNHRECPLEPP